LIINGSGIRGHVAGELFKMRLARRPSADAVAAAGLKRE
jgi:hypothetical protein